MSLLPLPSLAIFCPQSKAPKEDFLDQMHRYLSGKEELKPFLRSAMHLIETWSILANHREDIAAMSRGPVCVQALTDWIAHRDTSSLLSDMSGILALPLLTIIQVGQYFQFLELNKLSHSKFLEHLQSGGIHGYCGGLLPAIAIASSSDEAEVVANASKCLRVALAMGAYSELGGDDFSYGSTTMVIRLQNEGQGEEIIQKFPGVGRSPFHIWVGQLLKLFVLIGVHFRHYRSQDDKSCRSRPCACSSPAIRPPGRTEMPSNTPARQGAQSRECLPSCRPVPHL